MIVVSHRDDRYSLFCCAAGYCGAATGIKAATGKKDEKLTYNGSFCSEVKEAKHFAVLEGTQAEALPPKRARV